MTDLERRIKEANDEQAQAEEERRKRIREALRGIKPGNKIWNEVWNRSLPGASNYASLLDQLFEAKIEIERLRKLAEWQPITSENLPKDETDEVLNSSGEVFTSGSTEAPYCDAEIFYGCGFTLFPPINPPKEATK